MTSTPAPMAFYDAARCLAELGHPHRLQIFNLLIRAGEDGLSVGEIQAAVGIPAHHIAQLVSAGLMTQRREGRIQRCRVDAKRSRQLLRFLVTDCCGGLPDLAELLRAASPRQTRRSPAPARRQTDATAGTPLSPPHRAR
jgi:ArsR family transcriptional regulator, arsenate/arsenite/antimonite-responsive transcriptional repressor